MDLNHHTTDFTLCTFTFSRSHTYAVPLHRRSLLRTFLVDSNHPGSSRRLNTSRRFGPSRGREELHDPSEVSRRTWLTYLLSCHHFASGFARVASGYFWARVPAEHSLHTILRRGHGAMHHGNAISYCVCYDRLMRPVYIGHAISGNAKDYLA